MPRMEILSPVEREEFDNPPTFTFVQQQHYFDPPLEVIRLLKRLKTPTARVVFLLSYGYFLATHRFYPVQQFREPDIHYVTKTFGWPLESLELSSYGVTTQTRHRHLIRTLCQFRWCDQAARQHLVAEVRRFAKQHWHPRQIFLRLVDQLTAQRIEIPRAVFLSRLIATTLTQHRLLLARRLGTYLTPAMCQGLNALLTPATDRPGPSCYRLSQLKRLSQSTKPTKVHARLQDLEEMRRLYQLLVPVLSRLDLPQRV